MSPNVFCAAYTARRALSDKLAKFPGSDSGWVIVVALLFTFEARGRALLLRTRWCWMNAWRGYNRRRSFAAALAVGYAVTAKRIGSRLQRLRNGTQH